MPRAPCQQGLKVPLERGSAVEPGVVEHAADVGEAHAEFAVEKDLLHAVLLGGSVASVAVWLATLLRGGTSPVASAGPDVAPTAGPTRPA